MYLDRFMHFSQKVIGVISRDFGRCRNSEGHRLENSHDDVGKVIQWST